MNLIFGQFKLRISKFIFSGLYKPGHFYHPIPDIKEVNNRYDTIIEGEIEGIDLNLEQQFNFLQSFKEYSNDIPWKYQKTDGLRYYFENSFFNFHDAVIYYSILRKFLPKNIIEVGSGFSSALALDVNDKFLSGQIKFTFIEPYPERLQSLLTGNDSRNVEIKKQFVQNVDPKLFQTLEANDILFIDSSHISKIGSDLNFLLFKIFPLLKPGVIIHLHDICYPFEYPLDWIQSGIYWNEAYILRAFLMYNQDFKIIQFNHMIGTEYFNKLKVNYPEINVAGGSIWLIKE